MRQRTGCIHPCDDAIHLHMVSVRVGDPDFSGENRSAIRGFGRGASHTAPGARGKAVGIEEYRELIDIASIIRCHRQGGSDTGECPERAVPDKDIRSGKDGGCTVPYTCDVIIFYFPAVLIVAGELDPVRVSDILYGLHSFAGYIDSFDTIFRGTGKLLPAIENIVCPYDPDREYDDDHHNLNNGIPPFIFEHDT